MAATISYHPKGCNFTRGNIYYPKGYRTSNAAVNLLFSLRLIWWFSQTSVLPALMELWRLFVGGFCLWLCVFLTLLVVFTSIVGFIETAAFEDYSGPRADESFEPHLSTSPALAQGL